MFLIQNVFIIFTPSSNFSLKYYLHCDEEIHLKSFKCSRNNEINAVEYKSISYDRIHIINSTSLFQGSVSNSI